VIKYLSFNFEVSNALHTQQSIRLNKSTQLQPN